MILVNDNTPLGARGMARYFEHTLRGIIDHFGDQVVVFSHLARDYSPAAHIRAARFKGSEQFGLHDKLASLALHCVKPQVVYSAWFNNLRTSAAQAIVMYDLIYELFPQYHSRWRVPFRNFDAERRRSIEQAELIFAISHSTARDLVRIYPKVDPAKIKVTPLGVDAVFFADEGQPTAPSARPYFLYVGSRTGHKNSLRLMAAYGQSGLARDFDLKFVSARPFDAVEFACMQRHGVPDRVQHIPHASDGELRRSYAGAMSFVYPSEYEGFGLPILEAMASGTLVATSNASSMPEVGGDVAFYFDPYDVEAIAETLRHVAHLSTDERKQRIAQGRARARSFTWERCQQKTVSMLEELLLSQEAKS